MSTADRSIVSKSEFARICGVDPGRVSQWIAERKLTGAAFVGEGRSARINVPIAQRQLRRALDPNQMTANGSGTDLGAQRAAEPTRVEAQSEGVGSLDLTDERARLAKEQADDKAMRNAERRGELINASEAEQRWSAEIIEIRTQLLRIPSEVAAQLPELTPVQLDKIDRVIRDALVRAADKNS